MGCNGSKSTETSSSNGQKPKDNADGLFLSVEEAIEQVQTELGCSRANAELLVNKANKNNDNKVANDELITLWNKIKEKKEELKPKFAKYDKDNSGKVSSDEALEVLQKKFSGVKEEHLKKMIGRYCDADNQMSYNDFIYFYANVKARKDELKTKFNDLDKDDSGDLSPEEVVGMVKEECALDDTMARCLIEDFDNNNDGKLNKKEFNNLFVKLFEDQADAEAEKQEEAVE